MYGSTSQNRQEADREELSNIYGISEVDYRVGERLVTVANRTGLASYCVAKRKNGSAHME